VHAEYFVLDDGGYGHAVETVNERFPKFDVVSAFAYVQQKLHYS